MTKPSFKIVFLGAVALLGSVALAAQVITTQSDKPILVPLSAYQREQIAVVQQQINNLQTQQQNFIVGIVSSRVHDPAKILGSWTIQLKDSTLILTPPTQGKP